MAIVNEIKCARCDRKYSGVRSRCPYCGARRIGRGKYSDDSDNARGKMLISVLIMAVFTVGAAVLLFTTPGGAEVPDPGNEPGLSTPDDDIDVIHGLHPDPTPSPSPEPPPVLRLEISSIQVIYSNSPWNRESFTLSVNEVLPFDLKIEPPGFDKANDFNIEFESSNPDVFDVVEVPMGSPDVYGFRVSWTGPSTRNQSGGRIPETVRVIVTNNGNEYTWSTRVYSAGS